MSIYGFLTTYLYVNHLRGDGASVPLAASALAWMFAAPYAANLIAGLSGIRRGRRVKILIPSICSGYLLALLSLNPSLPLVGSIGLALSSFAICSGGLYLLGSWSAPHLSLVSRSLLLAGLGCHALWVLTYHVGLDLLVLQLLFNLSVVGFALCISVFSVVGTSSPRARV